MQILCFRDRMKRLFFRGKHAGVAAAGGFSGVKKEVW